MTSSFSYCISTERIGKFDSSDKTGFVSYSIIPECWKLAGDRDVRGRLILPIAQEFQAGSWENP